MTLTKQTLGEALADVTIFTHECPGPGVNLEDAPRAVKAAARFVERLLPAACGECQGVGTYGVRADFDPCNTCHGTGQLWDEGLEEVVGKALFKDRAWFDEAERAVIRAVLAVLAEEVEK